MRSDAILLERILLNLVSNAVRYTREGGVVVGCRRAAATVAHRVWDSGIGIAEGPAAQHLQRVLPAGAGGAGSAARGLGLGLAIVERLCALARSSDRVVVDAGRGSRFSVSVPIVAGSRRAAPTRSRASRDSTRCAASSSW